MTICGQVLCLNMAGQCVFAGPIIVQTAPDRKIAEDGYVECKKCADEHRQLAEWLKELKERREKDGYS